MELTEVIGRRAGERLVVLGSLPPDGRDLDLLVPRGAGAAVEAGLVELGFERRGRVWARFERCQAEVVDLAPAESLGLPDPELHDLFADATPIEPSDQVCRPAPHHALLLLAGRTMREGPRLAERRRERIAVELSRDPSAFDAAERRAHAWGASAALPLLRDAYRSGEPLALASRRRAIGDELRSSRGRISAMVGSWRAVLRRPRRGAVIGLSGLDGSGKSSQARALADALDRLGWDAEVVWTSVAFHPPWLGAGARAVKRGLSRFVRSTGEVEEGDRIEGGPRDADDPGKILRSRSRLLTFAWSMTLSGLMTVEVVRKLWPPRLRGKVVVCDRHLLDAWAHLLYQYGGDSDYRVQLALLRAAFGRPALACLLEVSPETAARRKPEYDVAQNARRAAIYRQLSGRVGVRVVDGERTLDQVCAEVAREAWAALA